MIPIHRIFFKLSSSNQYHKRNLPTFSVCCHRFSNSTSSFKKNYDSIGIFFFSSISCVAFGLGCWQLQRYQQKLVKLLDSKKSLHQLQIDIPSLAQMELNRFLSGLVNRKVCLGYGEYQHHLETLLGPRSSPVGRSAQGMASNPQGYFVVTPFRRDDGNIVFVNRGWIPLRMSEWNRPKGKIHLNAVVSSWEKGGLFSPKNVSKSGKVLWLEKDSMLETISVFNLDDRDKDIPIVEAIDEGVVKDGSMAFPVHRSGDIEARPETISPLTHIVYAITWFSLAIAGTLMTYIKFRRPSRLVGDVVVKLFPTSQSRANWWKRSPDK